MSCTRKWSALLLSLLLVFSLSACGGGESEPSDVSSVSELSVPDESSTTTVTTTAAADTETTAKTSKTKVNVMTSKTTQTTTTTKKVTGSKNPLGMTVNGIKKVICWGDSITEGMAMGDGQRYPDVLQVYLGEQYNVLNAGSGGDSSYAIMARQGALTLKTNKEISFGAGVSEVKIGHNKESYAMTLSNGMKLEKGLNVQADVVSKNLKKLRFNPLTIGGKTYRMNYSLEGQTADSGYNLLLTRTDASEAVTIPAGTEVVMASADESDTSYCEIIHMGANDKLSLEATTALVERYQMMLDRMPHECYLIVIPYWAAGRFDSIFEETFGDKAINFGKEIAKRGLSELGLTATEDDLAKMAKNQVPIALQYKTHDGCHLNEYGYKMLATLVYERGKQLKYWE